MRRIRPGARGVLSLWVIAVLLASGCATLGPSGDRFGLSDEAQHGDPARRASTRLLLRGLDADEAGRAGEAVALYERALQVDPTNPWAYLCLARFEVESGDPHRALDYLDKAEALLPPDGAEAARVHVTGLRGASLQMLGRSGQAEPLLAEARRGAPSKWADGQLDAAELR